MSTNNTTTFGWVSQPDGRGTLDIIQSCLLTIILCCWTSLCVNVSGPKDSSWRALQDKFNLACIGILGPEILFMLAVGEWQSANASVKEMKGLIEELGQNGHVDRDGTEEEEGEMEKMEWSMEHAFFADMGGFVLKVREWPAFPIDAKQIFYLVKHGYIEFPTLHKLEIKDRNKVDGLARAITIFQVLWFTLNLIFRLIQHLEITTFELTTVAFIPCMIASSLCWAHKPTDISRPIVLTSPYTIQQIILEAGSAAKEPYVNTPLDFISRSEWCISILWTHDINILRSLHLPFFSRPIQKRPIDRVPNDRWRELNWTSYFLALVLSAAYSAIFIAGWNLSFPSETERLLWHISSLGTPVVGGLFFTLETWWFRLPRRGSKWVAGIEMQRLPLHKRESRKPTAWEKLLEYMRNNTANKDPLMRMELKKLIPLMVLCALYSVFRWYILVEDVVGLRSLPASVFETVDWSRYVPHL